MKIEDDPTITPGSVARSPLSIATAKESDLFTTSGKTSPTDAINLTSSTWSFNPGKIMEFLDFFIVYFHFMVYF